MTHHFKLFIPKNTPHFYNELFKYTVDFAHLFSLDPQTLMFCFRIAFTNIFYFTFQFGLIGRCSIQVAVI